IPGAAVVFCIDTLCSAVDGWLITSTHHYLRRSQVIGLHFTDKCAWSYEIIPFML
ncbi:hypothetical protein R6Q57_000633, partial [Mikania cordata]